VLLTICKEKSIFSADLQLTSHLNKYFKMFIYDYYFNEQQKQV